MEIHRDLDHLPVFNKPIVTVGTFDGVHLGHRQIINHLKEIARKIQGETIIITFEPHPRLVLPQYGVPVKLITSTHRKYQLLSELGIDHLIVLPFTIEFSMTPWEVFIREFIVNQLHSFCLVVGYDHRFGHDREGDHLKLQSFAHELGLKVEEVSPLLIDGEEVSSTRIRNALHAGNIRLANSLLGYAYTISGKVIHGNRLGHQLGFPTANILADDRLVLIAANGVYVSKVEYKGKIYGGMSNIGVRPTIAHSSFAVEVHIFDFNDEIYDEVINISFIDRLRDEIKFDSLEQLKNQLKKDKIQAQSILEGIQR